MFFNLINFLLLIFIVVAPVVYLGFVLHALKPYLIDSKKHLAIFCGFVILYFNKLLFGGQTLAQQDFNNLQITFFKFFQQSALAYKSAPIWNSYTGGGYDAFANPLANYFSPFLWVFLVFKDAFYAANIYLVLQTLFTLIFAFALFRILKLSKSAAFVGATMLTFNAFFTMRLSPGVGVEYFFSVKWIVLSLAFTHLYFITKKSKFVLLTAISLAFMFEGNMNGAIVGGIVWLLYSIMVFGLRPIKFYAAPLLALLLFSIRFIPNLYLILTAKGRISETVQGWRIERIEPIELWEYFLPINKLFQTPAFTPGIIGILFFGIGFWYLAFKYKRMENNKKVFLASLALFATGVILVTVNPVSSVFFSLPFFNRLTILPAFILFLLIPAVIISALFAHEIVQKYKAGALITFLPFIIFLEVFIGPPTLGAKTYFFNFLKMDYASEMQKLEYYNYIQDSPKVGLIIDDKGLLLFPQYNAYNNVYLLNDFKYLYGSTPTDELAKRINFNDVRKYADVVIATREVARDTNLLKVINVPRFEQGKYENYAILDRAFLYDNLQDFNWDYKVKIYEPLDKSIVSVKKNNSHPTEHTFVVKANNYEDSKKVITSITYSPFWKTSNNVQLVKGKYGFIEIENANVSDKIVLKYVNPYIYIGFVLSFCTFVIMAYKLWKQKSEV